MLNVIDLMPRIDSHINQLKKVFIVSEAKMPRGGARPGAGRKRGVKRQLMVEATEFAQRSGKTPLAFLLDVMNDAEQPVTTRLAAATAAAPFCHPRLSASLHANMPAAPDGAARARLDAMLDRISAPSPLIELPAVAVDPASAKEVTVLETRRPAQDSHIPDKAETEPPNRA